MENSDDVVSESAVDRNPSDTSELLSNTGTSAEVSRVNPSQQVLPPAPVLDNPQTTVNTESLPLNQRLSQGFITCVNQGASSLDPRADAVDGGNSMHEEVDVTIDHTESKSKEEKEKEDQERLVNTTNTFVSNVMGGSASMSG